MKTKITLLILVCATLCAVLCSCLVVAPSPAPTPEDGDKSYAIIYPSGGHNMIEVRDAYYRKFGDMLSFYSDADASFDNELVFGETNRPITTAARAKFNAAAAKSGYEDAEGFVIMEQNGSVAIWWSTERVQSLAVESFIADYVSAESVTEFGLADGFVRTEVFSLREFKLAEEEALREEYYSKIAEGLGDDVATSLQNLYSIYDERLYLWEASLFDPGVGGYYYSNSALANQGYLPDLESTVQALRFIVKSGMLNNYGGQDEDLQKVIPVELQEKFIAFAHSCQSPEDGYYYHPQWGENVSSMRQGRDLGWGTSLLEIFGQIPLYDTPGGVKGSLGAPGAATSYLTDGIGESTVSAVSRVIAVATVADRFSSEEKFEEYFNSFEWADPRPGTHSGSSYHHASTLQGQASQIKAAGLGPKCVELFDAMQERVQQARRDAGLPENGLWDPENSYDAINGVMKVSLLYSTLGAKIKYADKIMECVIEMITHEGPDFDGVTPTASYSVYNLWVAASNVLSNLNKHGSPEEAEAFRAIIRENAAEMINITAKKAAVFKRDDGSFGITVNGKGNAGSIYGAPICIPGAVEGDINGAGLVSTGMLGELCKALKLYDYIGISVLPLYYESDLDSYLEVMLSASPVVKDEIVVKDAPIDFEGNGVGDLGDEVGGLSVSTTNGSFTVVEDDFAESTRALELVTTPSDVGGDRITIKPADTKKVTSCYALEWRMCIVDATGWRTPLQVSIDGCYMLSFKQSGGEISVFGCSDTNETKDDNLGIVVKMGEWHEYRVEYYPGEDGALTKIYVDGVLRAVNDNYSGKAAGNAPSTKFAEARFFSPKKTEATIRYDDLYAEKLDQIYVEEEIAGQQRVKDFENTEDGELPVGVTVYDGSATVVDNPDGDGMVLELGGGTTLVGTVGRGKNCFVYESLVYVSAGSGKVAELEIAAGVDKPVASYALVAEDGGVLVKELYRNGLGAVVTGRTLAEFDAEEWVTLRIEYYRYQRKALISVDGGEPEMSEAYYKIANVSGEYSQVNIRTFAEGALYLDDLIAEKINKAYVEGGVEIEDDTEFPKPQGSTTTSAPTGYDGAMSFDSFEEGEVKVPGLGISMNGELGNSIAVAEDPEDADNKVLKISTVASDSRGNTVKFSTGDGVGDKYVFRMSFCYEQVGNANGNIAEIYLKSGKLSESGQTIFSFAIVAGETLAVYEKGASKNNALISGITKGEWHELVIEYDPETATATVSVDGEEAVSSNIQDPANGALPFDFVSILNNKGANVELLIDDVLAGCSSDGM